MSEPDKSKREKRPAETDEGKEPAAPETRPGVSDAPHSGRVVRSLPNDSASRSGVRRHTARRLAGWLIAIIVLCALIAPVVAWVHYRQLYVTSTNAAVRGHVASIGTQLDSRVTAVEVSTGDRVTEGEVLVRLQNHRFEADVAEITAELRGLKSELEVERLSIEHGRHEIEQRLRRAQADLRAAEAQRAAAEIRLSDAREVENVRQSLNRNNSGAISSEEVRAATTRRRTAEAQVDESEANYLVAQSTGDSVELARNALAIREQRVAVLESDIARAEARLARAKADLEGTVIRAPADGAVLRRAVQPGASVQVGQPLVSVWLGDELWIEAWIDEDDIGHVTRGSKAVVTLPSIPDREFPGVVERIGLATDFEMPASEVPLPRFTRMRGSPVVGIRVRLDDPPPELVPGMSAVVAIARTAGSGHDTR